MKNRTKIIIPLIFIICIAISALFILNSGAAKSSIPEINDAEGRDFTDNSYIAGKLNELFGLLPYSDYPYFTVTGNTSCGNSSCAQCNGKNVSRMHPNLKDLGVIDTYDSWSCFAFARYAFQYIYGVQASGLSYYGNTDTNGTLIRVGRIASNTYDLSSISGGYSAYNLQSLKDLLHEATPGDILQARSRTGSVAGNHTMLFLSCDDDGIYVLHNNMYRTRLDSNGNAYGYNRVLISFISYEAVINTWNSIFTVYRAQDEVYTTTWNKGVSICNEHSYTASNGDYCVNCGSRFSRPVSTDCIGNYALTATGSIHKTPYTSSAVLPQSSDIVTVIAKETNSIGENWYKTVDGGYIPVNEALLCESSDKISIIMTAYPVGAKTLHQSFTLKGTVSSSSGELSFVGGYLISVSGNCVQSVTVNPGGNSLSIEPSDINYKLQFGSLIIGKYTMAIVVADKSGNYGIFTTEFSIATKGDVIVKNDVAAPPAPKASTVADTYVVLESGALLEFSINGTVWQSSNFFSDLKPRTEYTFYCRYIETELTNASPASAPLRVSTDYDRTPPPAPTVSTSKDGQINITATSVILTDEGPEYEYSRDGENWQSSPEFKGLTPATKYMFFKRNKDARVSSAGRLVLTLKSTVSAPAMPAVISFTDTSIDVIYLSGFEYGIREARTADGIEWQDPETFTGRFENLSPATDYYIYCIISETDSTFRSAPSEASLCKTDKSFRSEAPAKPVLVTKNSSTVTLLAITGCEYSTDGINFTTNTTFSGFTPGLTYNFVCRYAETETHYSSDNSPELNIEIIPDYLTSKVYKINEITKFISGINEQTTVAELLEGIDQSKYATVYHGDTKKNKTEIAVTGDSIIIIDVSGVSAEYTVIISGDTNGDGSVTITDLLNLKKYLSFENKDSLSLEYASSDLNGDGYVNVVDYAILKHMIFISQDEKTDI